MRRCCVFAISVAFATLAHSSAAAAPSSIDGRWLSDGYGQYFEIEAGTLRRFDVTRTTCVSSAIATRDETDTMPGVSRFSQKVGEGANTFLRVFLVTPQADPTRLVLQFEGAISTIALKAATAAPKACAASTPPSRDATATAFKESFGEHYPFFALHGVDWTKRGVLTSDERASDKTLFDAMTARLLPLRDAHIFLSVPDKKWSFEGYRPGNERQMRSQTQRIRQIIETGYTGTPLTDILNGKGQWGVIGGRIGLLRLSSFWNYDKEPGFTPQLAALERALDTALGSQKLDGLIIDVRLNTGGSDIFGTTIAARLATRPYFAYAKIVRNDPADPTRFTAPEPFMIVPSTRPSFHGQVVLLTGPDSVSAAETFAMAMMGRTPGVHRVGQPTQGVFSDVLSRRLPNGWELGLPNEIYLTHDGRAFDGPGVPPDEPVEVFLPHDLSAGRDTALEAALRHLGVDWRNLGVRNQ